MTSKSQPSTPVQLYLKARKLEAGFMVIDVMQVCEYSLLKQACIPLTWRLSGRWLGCCTV